MTESQGWLVIGLLTAILSRGETDKWSGILLATLTLLAFLLAVMKFQEAQTRRKQ